MINKRSQSEVITWVLIILLVLAAIIIVWQVVTNQTSPFHKDCQNITQDTFVGTFNIVALSDFNISTGKMLTEFTNATEGIMNISIKGTPYFNCTADYDGLSCTAYDRLINDTCAKK